MFAFAVVTWSCMVRVEQFMLGEKVTFYLPRRSVNSEFIIERGRSLLEVPCAFIVPRPSVSVSVCQCVCVCTVMSRA